MNCQRRNAKRFAIVANILAVLLLLALPWPSWLIGLLAFAQCLVLFTGLIMLTTAPSEPDDIGTV